MAEKEIEDIHIRNKMRLAYISTVLSFISVLVLSALIGFSLYIGSFNTAIGVAIGAIASVAGVFVYSKASRSRRE